MHLSKLLCTTMILGTAFTAYAQEGTFIRGQLGGTKFSGAKEDSENFNSLPSYKKDRKAGWYGGIGIEHRQQINSNLSAGVLVDMNLDTAHYKQEGHDNTLYTVDHYTEVKRNFVTNVLGQLGWNVKPQIMPYVLAGGSYTKFKFSETAVIGSTMNAYGYKRSILGYGLGAGIAHTINAKWSMDIRYLYTNYGTIKVTSRSTSADITAPSAYHAATLGISYKL